MLSSVPSPEEVREGEVGGEGAENLSSPHGNGNSPEDVCVMCYP